MQVSRVLRSTVAVLGIVEPEGAAQSCASRRPALYRLATSLAMRVLGLLGRFRGRFRRLPLAGGWTATRALPAQASELFMATRLKGRWRTGPARRRW